MPNCKGCNEPIETGIIGVIFLFMIFIIGYNTNKTTTETSVAHSTANGSVTTQPVVHKPFDDFVRAFENINPYTPKLTYIIFEVPKDLNIADGIFTNKSETQTVAEGFYTIKELNTF